MTLAGFPTSLPGRASQQTPGREVAWTGGLLAIVIFLIPGAAESLQYDRAALAGGEWWRLITCHWTHWSLEHLLWDVVVFVALAYACAVRRHCQLGITLVVASIAIPTAVWIAQPELITYRGLSGLDSALMMLLTVDVIRNAARSGHRGVGVAFVVLAAGFAGKIAYECVTGAALFVDSHASAFVPVPLAHAVGGIIGALTLRRFR